MKSAVYKLGKDGQSDLYWSSNTDVGFDLEMSPDNRVLVATSYEGKNLRHRSTETLHIAGAIDRGSNLHDNTKRE